MLTDDDILSIVSSELSLSDSSTYNGTGNVALEESLSYYLGLPNGTEVEGRSQITSTDVADAIEWIMPQIMKSFTQNNEVVIFDPVHEGDEKQAELESEYVYEVLMKQNDGFIILHQFVKDALMQRNGILKVYYAKHDEVKTADYTGINENQFNSLLSAEGVEMLEKSEYIDELQTKMKEQQIQQQLQQMEQSYTQQREQAKQQGQSIPYQMEKQWSEQKTQLMEELEKPVFLYDIKVSVTRNRGQIYIDPVPPEEFRLNAQHNSICLDDARFTAHVLLKPVSDLITEYGLTKKETDELSEGSNFYDREYRFSLQNESVYYDRVDAGDDSQRLIEISECYLKIDVEETGISKLMKVTVSGGDSPEQLLSVEDADAMPWVSTTAFLMSHKFQGMSITDRLKQIQDQKTALWRNMFDNMYLQNNQRNVVIEGQVNMDDLLVSRPGGIIRAKRLDAITPLVTPQLGQDAYNMMTYLDQVRAGRTGVDPDGSATPANIGDRVGSEGVDRLMNAKEELVGLIIRVVAETGIKPLCIKIRDLTIKHIDAVTDFRFRGQWYQINPSEWPDRTMCTVRVGTGTGNHQLQTMALMNVLQTQKELAAAGSILISEKKAFDTMDDYCKFNGLNGAVRYFVDPDSPEGQQAKAAKDKQTAEAKDKADKIEIAIAQAQVKIADAEMAKAQAQGENVKLKNQVEQGKNLLTLQDQQSDNVISSLKQQLEEVKTALDVRGKDQDRALKERDSIRRTALELTRIEKDSEKDENENFEKNKEAAA
jgi:hypothetical protein